MRAIRIRSFPRLVGAAPGATAARYPPRNNRRDGASQAGLVGDGGGAWPLAKSCPETMRRTVPPRVIPGRPRKRANPESRDCGNDGVAEQFEIPGSRFARPGMTCVGRPSSGGGALPCPESFGKRMRRTAPPRVIPGRPRQRANPESRDCGNDRVAERFEIPGSRFARPGMTCVGRPSSGGGALPRPEFIREENAAHGPSASHSGAPASAGEPGISRLRK